MMEEEASVVALRPLLNNRVTIFGGGCGATSDRHGVIWARQSPGRSDDLRHFHFSNFQDVFRLQVTNLTPFAFNLALIIPILI
jgi:hypothetical protein